ncbi:uroporphyrinogen-III C-methyltransferase [Vibrio tapetis subsp. quintayensis]|uniref:uroporphyrinogen-III C-methyltransferase n=1 Tax=Vibrio tapetis TaxID=52443 RepID=UPI0025B3B765|nr:uroporphyrinogen-III C-methyltransferase [Vibrio tapetis]MDN3680157.1 uroporphyrinogen-III C-methyltransferase [Vibrio tapetis subsp. quintayensis]
MTSKKNNNEHIEPEETSTLSDSADASVEVTDTNTDQTVTDSKEAPATKSQADTKESEKKKDGGKKLGTIAIILSLLFGGGLTYHIQQQNEKHLALIDSLKSEMTQLKSSTNQELGSIKQDVLSKAEQMTQRSQVVLDQQQTSIESLQVALADVKGRRPNDWLLAEADYLVKLAGRKLFLEHDVVSATRLMESADQRIAALNDPSLVTLRKSMANDITQLRSLPLIDREGLVLALTSLQQEVDKLPLANAILPDAPEVVEQVVSEDINDWQNNLTASLKGFSEQFITFRTRDGDVVPLLSPEQHFYLRENIKAKLETAIKGVYVEQGDIYQTAVKVANEWSHMFFNQDDASVAKFQQRLEQLGKQNINVDYPQKLETQQQLSDVITDRLRREVTTLVSEEQ